MIFIRREVLAPNPSVNSSALILRLHLVSMAPLSPLCSHLRSGIFQIVGPGLSFVSSCVRFLIFCAHAAARFSTYESVDNKRGFLSLGVPLWEVGGKIAIDQLLSCQGRFI